MRLIVDLSHLISWNGRLSGIERVEYNVAHYYLNKKNKSDIEFVAWDSGINQITIKSHPEVDNILNEISTTQAESLPKKSDIKKRALHKRITNKFSQKSNLYQPHDGDVLLVLDGLWDNKNYISEITKIAQSVTINHIVYDMIPIVAKGYVLDFVTDVFADYMMQVLPLCDRIFAISKSTAKDIKSVTKLWEIDIPKAEVFQLGDDIPTTPSHKEEILNENYYLAAGTVEIRKNYRILLDVYGLAREQGVDLPPTYIIGRLGWLTEEFQYIVKYDDYYSTKIKLMGSLTDDELANYYKKARLIICPSLYEGWGLPVREALAYGKITIASNTSSLPEAGGNLADYFSPHDPQALLELLIKYQDDNTRRLKEKLISDTYKPLSWTQAIKDLDKKINT